MPHSQTKASATGRRHPWDFLPTSFRNSYRYRERDHSALLHGVLRVQILRANNLRNVDIGNLMCQPRNVIDPYVNLYAIASGGVKSRLVKTGHQSNTLDPIFHQEEHTVYLCHFVQRLEFQVKDFKKCGNILKNRLGRVRLSLVDILKFDSQGRELCSRIHGVDYLDQNPRHGSLEYTVQYVPAYMLESSSPAVPGTYFCPTPAENHVRFYITANMDPRKVPEVRKKDSLLSLSSSSNKTQVHQCWNDMYHSLCNATKFIYIVGWSVDYTQSLLRGQDLEQALQDSRYSPYIGQLLQQKAAQGVTVNMLVWDDQTSSPALHSAGFLGTGDEELRDYFKDSAVNCHLVPMGSSHVGTKCCDNVRNAFFYTHHQKTVICDDPDKRDLVAYIGGIDLTTGRWDDGTYRLFRTLQSAHKGDFKQSCLDGARDTVGPRLPWHDIHMRVQGPGAVSVLRNFEERWRCQVDDKGEKLVVWEEQSLSELRREFSSESTWKTQVFRSIDTRCAKFMLVETESLKPCSNSRGVDQKDKTKPLNPTFKQSLTATNADEFQWKDRLQRHKGRVIDQSCQAALIHHIRRARHVVYIESQYFLSSAFMWRHNKSST